MERAPIPPHERQWRHPSELVHTPTPVTEPRSNAHWLTAVATGAVAATLIAVLVVAAPRRSTAPVAMSSTTLPPFSLAQASPDASTSEVDVAVTPRSFSQVRVERTASVDPLGSTLTGTPRAIAAPLVSDATAVDATVVHLVTESHVYQVRADELDRVLAPDGSIVIDGDGRLLGSFVDGRFVDG